MNTVDLSRRRFTTLAGTVLGAADAAHSQTAPITARQVVERIQKNVGVPWRTPTRDTFKAGNPDTPLTGIATTFMSTLDVLQRAAAAGRNLIVTHEPTFWNDQDDTKDLAGDPVYINKQNFIAKNNLVIWRFHDHWHARKPDAVLQDLARILGWDKYQASDNPRLFTLPATTLERLARDIQSDLKIRTLRVIGDPKIQVSTLAVSPGFAGLMGAMAMLPGVDVFVAGEVREWEGVEYAQDTVASGRKKGMILLGHAISEDPGMDACAKWLRTFVPEVPVEWIPAGEPFWKPA